MVYEDDETDETDETDDVDDFYCCPSLESDSSAELFCTLASEEEELSLANLA